MRNSRIEEAKIREQVLDAMSYICDRLLRHLYAQGTVNVKEYLDENMKSIGGRWANEVCYYMREYGLAEGAGPVITITEKGRITYP